jgi:hypothetical protein
MGERGRRAYGSGEAQDIDGSSVGERRKRSRIGEEEIEKGKKKERAQKPIKYRQPSARLYVQFQQLTLQH